MSPAREPRRRDAPCLRSPAILGDAPQRRDCTRGSRLKRGGGVLQRGESGHHAGHSSLHIRPWIASINLRLRIRQVKQEGRASIMGSYS